MSLANATNNNDCIQYQVSDAAKTTLSDVSADVIFVQFIPHKLSHVLMMKWHQGTSPHFLNGRQIWLCEMDHETPSFAAYQANLVALFSHSINRTITLIHQCDGVFHQMQTS